MAEINPFTDIEYIPPELQESPTNFQSAKTMQVGFGSNVFRASREGIWVGRNTFEEARKAPTFAVSMDGTMYIQNILASGVTIFADTTLDDWRAAGDLTTIDGGEIFTNSITANSIAAGTITANEIAANTITANKMNVSELSAITANLGTVTAGTYQTAGVSTRIRIQDDDVQWQVNVAAVWQDAGVLKGSDSISSFEYVSLGFQQLFGRGIEHFNISGVAFYSEVLAADKIWADTQVHSPEIYGGGVFARIELDKGRLYQVVSGDNTNVQYNEPSNNQAKIHLDINSQVDANSNNIIGISSCRANNFYAAGQPGVTKSHTWVNAEGDTISLSVLNGIVTNFTVTP